MIKTLIIDDEQHAINTIINHLKPYSGYKICGTAKTVETAIELTKKIKPDLIFLDIILGTKTGFDFLNTFIPNIDFDVIFTTAYNDYAVEAFDYCALHYLLKPINADKFQTALTKVREKIAQKEFKERLLSCEHNFKFPNTHKLIHLPTVNGENKISSKDVMYLKSDSNYTDFYLIDRTKLTASKTLKYYAQLLEKSHFYRVHKSFLINTEQIKGYNKKTGTLIINKDINIPVAVRKQKEFENKFFS